MEDVGRDLLAETKAKFSSAWYSKPGVIYFISAGSDCSQCRSIKIGVTLRERLLGRLRAIQSANHTKIHLLGLIEFSTMREAEEREQILHRSFSGAAHIKGDSAGHEWFTDTPQIQEVINSEAVPVCGISGFTNSSLISKLFA